MVSCSLLVVNQFQKVSGFVFMLLGGWLYDDCFFLEGDAEFVLDVGGDGVGKGEDTIDLAFCYLSHCRSPLSYIYGKNLRYFGRKP